jgi:hypothetical protein
VDAKERHRAAIIEYMGDPDNAFPTRGQLPGICNISKPVLYAHFTPQDLSEIERQGLDLRRTRYIKQAANIDAALMRKAEEGDAQAAKLFYQRIENWSEKTKVDNTITIDEIKIELVSPKE